MRYRLTASARQDLDEIFTYWEERVSVEVADRLIDSIIDYLWVLGQFPKAGKPATETPGNLRRLSAGQYLVYYRISRRTIDIIHIFHGARSQERALRGRKKTT